MKKKKPSRTESLKVDQLAGIAGRIPSEFAGIPLGAQVRMIRNRLGMSQDQLAKRANVTKVTITKIERGEIAPRLDTMTAVFSGLECGLVILPKPRVPFPKLLIQRARAAAENKMKRVLGTMDLEAQGVAKRSEKMFLQDETDRLVRMLSGEIWNDPR